jgi:DnaJ-class molecular chaperone
MTYNFYTILGLDINNNPSQQEIKTAYKKKAIENHPDKNKDNKEKAELFKEISNAYSVLSDENKKRIYDQVGDDYKENDQGQGQHGHHGHHGFANHEDILEHLFGRRGGGNNPFEGFGFGGEEKNSKCKTIKKTINIQLDEVYSGVNKNIKISITKYCSTCLKKCENCNGEGMVKQVRNLGPFTQIINASCDICQGRGNIASGKKSCDTCKGKGEYIKEVNAHLNLPAGINDGYTTYFMGMGEQPVNTKQKAGDLLIEININPHNVFTRKNNDLYYNCEITFIDSIKGCNISIPYFKEELNINTDIFGVVYPKKDYMITGKGLPIENTNKKGNMYINFVIKYPTIKNKEKIPELESAINEVFYN